MKKVLKNQYKNFILVTVYTIIAILAYVAIVQVNFDNILVDVLVGLGVLVIGIVCGFLYIKSEYKEENNNDQEK